MQTNPDYGGNMITHSAAYDTESQARRAMMQFLDDHPGAIAHTMPMTTMIKTTGLRATNDRPAIKSRLISDPHPRWRLDASCAIRKDNQ